MHRSQPGEWREVRLGDLVRVKARLGWKGLKAEEYLKEGPVFLAAPNLRGGRIDFDNVDHLSWWRYDESPEIQLAVGDVLLVKDGSTLGMSAPVRLLPGPTTVNGSIAVLRPLSGLDGGFLYYAINGDAFQKLIWMKRAGLGVPHLFQADLREFRLRIPPRPAQSRIAEILSTVDEAIEQTEALIAKYQQIKAGLMHDLFTRGLTPQGNLRPTPTEAPNLYKPSPLGLVPMEWDAVRTSDFLTFIDAGKSPDCPDSPASDDRWGVLKVGAVHPDGFKQIENKVVENPRLHNPQFLVKANDLLLSRANTFELVGLVCRIESVDGHLMLSDKTLRLHPNITVTTSNFLFWVLQIPSSRRQIEIRATGTSGSMKNISQSGVREILVPRPMLEEQRRITHVLDGSVAMLRSLQEDLSKLRQQKLGLMQDLLTGRVRVPIPDAEEPAA